MSTAARKRGQAGSEGYGRSWRQGRIERIASIYRLNEARLVHYDPAPKRQTQAFAAAQRTVEKEFDCVFAHARQELDALPASEHKARPLRSLLNHRKGLSDSAMRHFAAE